MAARQRERWGGDRPHDEIRFPRCLTTRHWGAADADRSTEVLRADYEVFWWRLGTLGLSALLRRRAVVVAFDFANDLEPVLRLMQKYANIPMSLADACLVRMTEMRRRRHSHYRYRFSHLPAPRPPGVRFIVERPGYHSVRDLPTVTDLAVTLVLQHGHVALVAGRLPRLSTKELWVRFF